MLTTLTVILLYYAVLMHKAGFFLGLFSAAGVFGTNLDEKSAWRPIFFVAAALSALPAVGFFAIPYLAEMADADAAPSLVFFTLWAACSGGGVFGALWYLRHGVHKIEVLAKKLTKKSSLERNRRTDVRELDSFLPPAIDAFDPLKWVDLKKGIFVGLEENREPVYMDYADWKISHVLLTGRTRSFKGVAAQILLTQAVAKGEFVVILDPKADAWMPHVFQQAGARSGYPYHYLDLRQNAHAQFNMFAGCDAETIENMLIGAFSLAEKGDAADFYRLGDRKAARQVATWVEQQSRTTGRYPTAREVCAALSGQWVGVAEGFAAAMMEMAEIEAVNRPSGGIDIDDMAANGGCLYVVGDMGNTRIVRLQRMILLRLMMVAKKRDYINQEPRTITVFADEFKVHISRPFMTSLGAAAGWGLHCILAFQSLQDLADCPADLDKDSVRGGVMENCALQLSYKIKDPETAEWLAASTGQILVDDETRKIEKNIALAETFDGDRTVRLAERYYIDVNMLMNMPKGCGVLVGATRLPVFCYTSPVKVDRSTAAITPTIPPPDSSAGPQSAAAMAINIDED